MDKFFNRLAAFLAFCVVLLGANAFSQVEGAGVNSWLAFFILIGAVGGSALVLVAGEMR